jgi:LysR family hydrogen peroxide-inducible transcriptional activator
VNIRDLQYVVAVAEEQHFGRAAEKCHVSQPALSGQIRKLEDFLGVVLFERTNRSVRTTPVGELVIVQARRLITISEEIKATAQAAKDPFSGTFRLGMIPTIAPYLTPYILPAIRQGLPNLSLTLMEAQTTDLEARIANGELEGAVLATKPIEPFLNTIALYDEPFWVALPGGHILASKSKINFDEIKPEELLLLADGHCLRDQVMDVCHVKTGRLNTNTRETSLATLLALVNAGDGVTLVPALTRLSDNPYATIVIRPEATGLAGRRVQLAYRESFPGTELINRLVDIICSNLPKNQVKILP